MFTLRQLEVFLAVARRGHVTAAAADVHLSQSAVSAALAELAEQLGGPLFDRAGRGVVLNERGRSLVDRAAELTQRARDLAAHFLGSGTLAGRVRLGASSTIGTYLLPRLIGAFVDAHPEVHVDVEIGNSATIEARLVDHALDAAFIEGPSHHPALGVSPWRRDTLVVFAAAEHPLARRRRLAPDQLREARWIVREPGSGTRAVFEAALQAHDIQLVPHLTFGHSEAVKQAVRAGLGVGCLSRLAIELELARGEFAVLPTPELDLGRSLWRLGRRGAYVGPALQACLTSLAAESRPARRRRR